MGTSSKLMQDCLWKHDLKEWSKGRAPMYLKRSELAELSPHQLQASSYPTKARRTNIITDLFLQKFFLQLSCNEYGICCTTL